MRPAASLASLRSPIGLGLHLAVGFCQSACGLASALKPLTLDLPAILPALRSWLPLKGGHFGTHSPINEGLGLHQTYLRIYFSAFFSNLDTWAWLMDISSATSICVFPSKKTHLQDVFSLGANLFMASDREIFSDPPLVGVLRILHLVHDIDRVAVIVKQRLKQGYRLLLESRASTTSSLATSISSAISVIEGSRTIHWKAAPLAWGPL